MSILGLGSAAAQRKLRGALGRIGDTVTGGQGAVRGAFLSAVGDSANGFSIRASVARQEAVLGLSPELVSLIGRELAPQQLVGLFLKPGNAINRLSYLHRGMTGRCKARARHRHGLPIRGGVNWLNMGEGSGRVEKIGAVRLHRSSSMGC